MEMKGGKEMNLQVVEYNNQRVLTTAQMAEVYETESNNIVKNFSNHKERFTEGKDYYCLTGDELRAFKSLVNSSGLVALRTPSLILWTMTGAILHADIMDSKVYFARKGILEYFGVEESTVVVESCRKEAAFAENIKETFEGVLHFETQFIVDRYRIDMYCRELNLAIEFDEKHHKYGEAYDGERQRYIEESIGCKFLRIPENYELSKVANAIIKIMKEVA